MCNSRVKEILYAYHHILRLRTTAPDRMARQWVPSSRRINSWTQCSWVLTSTKTVTAITRTLVQVDLTTETAATSQLQVIRATPTIKVWRMQLVKRPKRSTRQVASQVWVSSRPTILLTHSHSLPSTGITRVLAKEVLLLRMVTHQRDSSNKIPNRRRTRIQRRRSVWKSHRIISWSTTQMMGTMPRIRSSKDHRITSILETRTWILIQSWREHQHLLHKLIHHSISVTMQGGKFKEPSSQCPGPAPNTITRWTSRSPNWQRTECG